MAHTLSITEVRGQIDAKGRLSVNESLPLSGPMPVRVWVLAQPADDEIDEQRWLASLAHNPAFKELSNPSENVYTLDDGKPFSD